MRNTYYSKIYLIVLVLSFGSFTDAQEPGEKEKTSFKPVENVKEALNSKGLDIGFGYKGELFSNFGGGMERRSVYLDNFDVVLSADMEKLFGWRGASFSAYVLGNNGGQPADYTGAMQGISNIAAHDLWKLYELKLEQLLLDGSLSLMTGLYDLNSEFDTRRYSAVFINPSHGIGAEFAASGLNGPSIFPNTAAALRVSYNISGSWNIKTAVLDGMPGHSDNLCSVLVDINREEGLLLTSEVNYLNEDEDYFKYALGIWYYTGVFEELGSAAMRKGNMGLYVSGEKLLYKENAGGSEGLGLFIRAGWANSLVNPVNAYYGAGIKYTGLIPGRENDILGLAVATAQNNEKYISLQAAAGIDIKEFEHIIEATYQIELNRYIKLQPDIQYIINPVNCEHNNHSIAGGARLIVIL